MKKFSSKGKTPLPTRSFQFELDDEKFTVSFRADADATLEWSELAAVADSEGDSDVESVAGQAFAARFFKLALEPAEYARFRAHMKKQHTHPDVLVEIMESIQGEVESEVEEEAERPTEQPLPSSGGPTATAERMLRIASIPDGDVVFAPPVPPEGSKATVRRQPPKKRKAG